MTRLPDHIEQPGPAGEPYIQVPTRLVDTEIELPAGITLDVSLAAALDEGGFASGCFRVADAPMSAFDYVIPDHPNDDLHVAWYSARQNPPVPGAVVDAAITCGPGRDLMYYHCHGKFRDARGKVTMGHLLPETCVPSVPVRITGYAFRDAAFQRVADAQTGFELFSPVAAHKAPDDAEGILLRITPNIEISEPLIACCRAAGWQRASVHGVGSLIGAHFANGGVLESYATEFYFTDGRIDLTGDAPSAALDIALVGLDGNWMEGRLQQGRNPVLITAEILLRQQK